MRNIVHDGEIAVVANCDILIPRFALRAINEAMPDGTVFCLSRWELGGRNAMKLFEVNYSQDTWVFRGPPREAIAAPFWFGVPGCDNRFSWQLRHAGYEVNNPAKTIKTYHVHATGRRTQTNAERHRVPPPYLYVEPIRLGDPQQLVEATTLEARKRAFRERRARLR
jgi:hypothetical protein